MNAVQPRHALLEVAAEVGILAQNPAVLRLILEQLYDTDPGSLATVRCVSTYYQQAADPVFYRHLKFRNCFNHGTEPSSCGFSDGLQLSKVRSLTSFYAPHVLIIPKLMDDSSCYLQTYVRHLQIGPFSHREPHQDYWQSQYTQDMTLLSDIGLSTQKIIDILHVLSNLQDFSWHVCCHIPSEILKVLHSRWPRARLHINLPHRKEQSGRCARLDRKAISSPQLYSLNMAFFYAETGVPGWEPQPCELPQLSKLITDCKNLRKLNLRAANNEDMDLLQPEPKFALPSLESFAIPEDCNAEEFNPSSWSSLINWSSLRHLRIPKSQSCHISVWKALTGSVFRLTRLEVIAHPTLVDCSGIRDFINSIDKLEEFVYGTWPNQRTTIEDELSVASIWHAIVHRHGSFLQKFKVDWHFRYDSQEWTTRFLEPLLLMSLTVEDLEFGVVMAEKDRSEEHVVWPEALMESLLQFSRLSRLQLGIAYVGAGWVPNKEGWMAEAEITNRQKFVVNFFEAYMKRYPYARLQELDFRFSRTDGEYGYPNGAKWRVKLTRLYPTEDGAPNYKTEIELLPYIEYD